MNNKRNIDRFRHSFFISYAWDDGGEDAEGVHEYLSKILPQHDYFIDKRLGIAKLNDINSHLRSADYLILIVTPAIFESKKVEKEYKFAKNNNLGILPCKPTTYDEPWEELKWNISAYIGIDYKKLDYLKMTLHDKIKKIGKMINDDKLSIRDNHNIEYKSKQKNINHSIKLQIINDRTVYPQNAIIYVRIILSDFIVDENILLLLFDAQKNIVLEKIIDPSQYKHIKLDDGKMFEIKFMLEDPRWEKEKMYELQATYGNAVDICNFMTDERIPIIQTDKSAYTFNSDMIITVIDPDGDKDSNKTENIGDRPDSLLTISCGDKKIVGYKLRETGNSTGIFQGIIGIIGSSGEKIFGYQLGDKIINKTQGTGPDDGFIQVHRGERIDLRYYNGEKTINLEVYSSNLGVSITLDQKVYSWRDTVYITIVAPDFNYDNKKQDVIGDGKESIVTASSSQGTISKFKIQETGSDTGIFTGEIMLTGFVHKTIEFLPDNAIGVTKVLDSGIGLLSTSKNDKIKISFSYEGKKIEAIANVQWYVGEIVWDKETYQIGDKARITVMDPDMSILHDKVNKFKIKVYSNNYDHDVEITLIETNISTGIFQGEIIFSKNTFKDNSIMVKKGDSVYAQYIDYTLPNPYSTDSRLGIIAECKIK